MDIEWKDGAVCYANGLQFKDWDFNRGELVTTCNGSVFDIETILSFGDFQLNEIRQGDYIEASELDTEQKYNDAVEAFGVSGFRRAGPFALSYSELISTHREDALVCSDDALLGTLSAHSYCKRKITYPQLMAIGKLKRAMIERDNALIDAVENTTILSDALNGRRSESHSEQDTVNNPSHYQFFEGVEVIEIIASSMSCEQLKGYCLGNRMKYRLRAGNKDKLEQDIAKSDKYVGLYDEHKHLCRIDGDLK